MNKIPDEVLAEILSQVPYSKQQHETLALVNQRFHNAVTSGVFRAKAAYRRFPELSCLLGHRSLSAEQFADIARRDARTEELLNRAMNWSTLPNSPEDDADSETGDHDNTRIMMKVCLVLIDYITSLSDGNSHHNALFLEWLKRDVFDADLTAMFRYSLNRVFDLYHEPSQRWFVELVDCYRGHASQLLAALSADVDGENSYRLNLILMRAYETLILTRTDKVSFLQSAFVDGRLDTRMEIMDDHRRSGRHMFTRLAKIYLHACVGNLPISDYKEEDCPDMCKATSGFDWRPLTRVNPKLYKLYPCDAHLIPRSIAGIFCRESGDEGYYRVECEQTAGPWEWMLDIMNLDFETVGKTMRRVRRSVNSGKVPRAIVEAVDNIAPSGLEASLASLKLKW